MRGKKDRNSRVAVVKTLVQADELKDLRVAQPVETDPGGAWAAPNSIPGQFFGYPVGLGGKSFLCRYRVEIQARGGTLLRSDGDCRRRLNRCAGVLPDDLDLPGDFFLIQVVET